MRKDFDLNLMQVFYEVYRQRSITRAADNLNTTQPAISTALKRLKTQLNCELFLREGRGIAATPAAHQLAKEVGPALDTLHSAVENLNEFDPQQRRDFLVYCNEPMLMLLQPLVEKSTQLGNCKIKFEITPHQQDKLLDALTMQKADLAIDYGQVDRASFEVQPYYQDSVHIAIASNHPSIGENFSLEQYFQQHHIGIKARRNQQYAINLFTSTPLQHRKVMVECDSLVAGLVLAASSELVTFIPKSLVENYASKLGLTVLPCPFDTNPVVHKLIWHKRNQHSEANRWLRDTLIELIR
ncbi:LysR family transcriptional regulator [Paraferrimonas haliotis]|uniref:Transcriptional regulator n=1 Tax=Paraferrimonas haliotis TaxID=2013866 RepID=A0AA37TPU3_9GAMM|nr:LysR family transcriptional regulator [Paraferrimonas haliotis]GLS84778.1 transcriptional regulator [Paraferrimonas haliotis]